MSADPNSSAPATAAPTPLSKMAESFKSVTGDAFGLGVALVVLPSFALYFGVERFSGYATTGLPLTAIFGIMILLGALSLVGTLYSRLNLADPKQALGLPAGSMRAFMALSLIVLFAIISIMVYRSMMEPFKVSGLMLSEREALVSKVGERVLGVLDEGCVAKGTSPAAASASATSAASPAASAASAGPASTETPPCADADHRYTLVLRPPPDAAATDLAKQLLILVGTLMTSVTSFYFAARTATPRAKPAGDSANDPSPSPSPSPTQTPVPSDAATAAGTAADAEAHADGCNVAVTDITADEDLPPAIGGVAS